MQSAPPAKAPRARQRNNPERSRANGKACQYPPDASRAGPSATQQRHRRLNKGLVGVTDCRITHGHDYHVIKRRRDKHARAWGGNLLMQVVPTMLGSQCCWLVGYLESAGGRKQDVHTFLRSSVPATQPHRRRLVQKCVLLICADSMGVRADNIVYNVFELFDIMIYDTAKAVECELI